MMRNCSCNECLIDELETWSYVRFYIEICGQLLAGECSLVNCDL
jgi:hypothetical protein